MAEIAIKIENLKKQYRLGVIGGTTLNAELQSWWARKRGKEDPNLKLGQNCKGSNETFWALKGIDLEVRKGETLGVIGANGAGKSTLLKVLSRVTAPTEGTIKINGRISSMLEVGTGFHNELTGRENIYMNGAILGMSKKEVDRKIRDIIEFSECEQFIDTPVKRYSSGMYVKLAFAVAANLDSEIMVMDEVLAVGDVKFQKKCLGKMSNVAEKEGKTVLYVSHNMNTVRNLCSRCIVLEAGRIIYDGDVESAIQAYLDSSKSELKTKFDNRGHKRQYFDFGKKVFISEIELQGKVIARYGTDEKMYIKVKWTANEDVENVKLGFSLKYVDSSNVGFTESENTISGKKGTKYETIFSFALCNLAEGIYRVYLNMFISDNIGGLHEIDTAEGIYFEVVETNNKVVSWQRRYWGSIRLNALQLINNEVKE
ncbi:MAG: ABC transporter ATP-binding protein [Lachnospiraceae bacterium]|nr:ABC transporter ATP-binding protein [Lachnospiraceae bacterium]